MVFVAFSVRMPRKIILRQKFRNLIHDRDPPIAPKSRGWREMHTHSEFRLVCCTTTRIYVDFATLQPLNVLIIYITARADDRKIVGGGFGSFRRGTKIAQRHTKAAQIRLKHTKFIFPWKAAKV